jgi:hypothetical protein
MKRGWAGGSDLEIRAVRGLGTAPQEAATFARAATPTPARPRRRRAR